MTSRDKSVEEMLAPYRTLAPFLRGDPVRQLSEANKEILHPGQIQGLRVAGQVLYNDGLTDGRKDGYGQGQFDGFYQGERLGWETANKDVGDYYYQKGYASGARVGFTSKDYLLINQNNPQDPNYIDSNKIKNTSDVNDKSGLLFKLQERIDTNKLKADDPLVLMKEVSKQMDPFNKKREYYNGKISAYQSGPNVIFSRKAIITNIADKAESNVRIITANPDGTPKTEIKKMSVSPILPPRGVVYYLLGLGLGLGGIPLILYEQML